jgi:uncharacterized membrane-anchored protein YhcB (DUF1043 family)
MTTQEINMLIDCAFYGIAIIVGVVIGYIVWRQE